MMNDEDEDTNKDGDALTSGDISIRYIVQLTYMIIYELTINFPNSQHFNIISANGVVHYTSTDQEHKSVPYSSVARQTTLIVPTRHSTNTCSYLN